MRIPDAQNWLIIGAARSGLAAARLLRDRGLQVCVIDRKKPEDMPEALKESRRAGFELRDEGQPSEALLKDGGALVLSPGVPTNHPLVDKARSAGMEIMGELELGARFFRGRILAVTGTNGKSTTTTLCAKILETAGIKTACVGNVGFPICDAVLDDDLNRPEAILAVEVSSYQLETIRDFRPAVAAILNLSPDHLARHGTMENYRDAKFRITENQTGDDALLLNADDPATLEAADRSRAEIIRFSLEGQVPRGVWLEGGALYRNLSGEKRVFLKRKDIPLKGRHNAQNVLAASLAAFRLGIPDEAARAAVKSFRGMEHRLEFTGKMHGVAVYNDSKATNLDSLEKALLSFEEPLILIAGGKDKGEDFSVVRDLLKKKVRAAVLLGESAERMADSWGETVPLTPAATLDEAAETALDLAKRGETILFSPGCSSFDMFKDFEDRGRAFKKCMAKMIEYKER